MKSNRDYIYEKESSTSRMEFSVIRKIVGTGKRVIDLGSGDGSLMKQLSGDGNECKGIEISQSGVKVSKATGLDVIKGRIDEKLPFKNKSFDFAICNVTLQMVMYP